MAARRELLRLRWRIDGRTAATVVAVAVAAIVVTSLVAASGDVPAWEATVARWINGWPGWLEPIMWSLQQVGIMLAPVVAGLVVVWSTRRWSYLVPFALVPPIRIFVESSIKSAVDRERPFTSIGSEIEVRGTEFAGAAFPSGHVATAFALALLLMAFVTMRWRIVVGCWAGMVGVARIYQGEHNLLDVVAGAALGLALGAVLAFASLSGPMSHEADEGS
ncbi:MAG: phosphatase PAP2 family protein [Ilumatobacter sp.]|uniref:phosphatase PAP2 family protein n=1 Tax=Ilumatobacter sp. TaxID=1967498 RepID=UPI00261E3B8B|nr:phosphatase PAP2 family protein [Ilumatobacter sp.]MDJ0770285.1 phosphatase PAP2 family protein [Ilumatobacter sp.]